MKSVSHFHDGGRYHIETNLLICGANQWIGFYMISASVMKGLTLSSCPDYFYFIFWNTGFFYKKNQAKIGKKSNTFLRNTRLKLEKKQVRRAIWKLFAFFMHVIIQK